ncbi:MAG TPA: SpoIIE family protein phosphatase [Atribacteraceae bacterium]|nr:SpoIIE family protein phosphatase [Atribacteraceae bacterium]
MTRLFVESFSSQICKHTHRHCGDLIKIVRRPEQTLAILADGMGSGINANIQATLYVEYLFGLAEGGARVADAVRSSLAMLHRAKDHSGPWAAFNVVQIKQDGEVDMYCYEAPQPLLLSTSGIEEPVFRPEYWSGEIVQHSEVQLRPQEAILVVSDGVTQAGLGRGLKRGWSLEGLKSFLVKERLDTAYQAPGIPGAVVRQAHQLHQQEPADDISTLTLAVRLPRQFHLLTGPPAQKNDLPKMLESFMNASGTRAACGGTTSKLLAEYLEKPLRVHPGKFGSPAHFELEGIDLASEGTITLNRLNNIFSEPELAEEAGYGPLRLLELINDADEIHFWVGQAKNPAHNPSLKTAGMMTRVEVIRALTAKLGVAGKLVCTHWF